MNGVESLHRWMHASLADSQIGTPALTSRYGGPSPRELVVAIGLIGVAYCKHRNMP
jgi:hypothetical protein